MRRFCFLIVFFVLAFVPLFAQTEDALSAPEISIPVFTLDIGSTPFNPDSTYLYKFPYHNVGTAPLLIIKAISRCPCISVSFPDSPLPPGQVDTIYVHFKPTRAGKFTQRVAVISNASEYPLLQLYAKATFLKSSPDKE